MSNKTQLQTNNTTLASLIQTLQGKATGGAVETCTVNIISSDSNGRPWFYAYTYLDSNGEIVIGKVLNNSSSNVTIENVLCGSLIIVRLYRSFYGLRNYVNAEHITDFDTDVYAIQITAPSGGIAQFESYNNESGGSIL